MEVEARLLVVDPEPAADVLRVGDRTAHGHDPHLLRAASVRPELLLDGSSSAHDDLVGDVNVRLSQQVDLVEDVQADVEDLLPDPPLPRDLVPLLRRRNDDVSP